MVTLLYWEISHTIIKKKIQVSCIALDGPVFKERVDSKCFSRESSYQLNIKRNLIIKDYGQMKNNCWML